MNSLLPPARPEAERCIFYSKRRLKPTYIRHKNLSPSAKQRAINEFGFRITPAKAGAYCYYSNSGTFNT